MSLVQALSLARRLYDGQVDKSGKPMLHHAERVAATGGRMHCEDPVHAHIAALLHDVLEDGLSTTDELLALGVPPEAVRLVVVLTKPARMPYKDYLEGIRALGGDALVIKLCDVQDNSDPRRLSKLSLDTAERLWAKYDFAKRVLLG